MTRKGKVPQKRLDEVVVARGIYDSLEEARRHIWAGEVIVGDQMEDQPAAMVAQDAPIRLRGKRGRFVSRGGEKLEAALRRLEVAAAGRVALDVGASTGGFTDCLLASGAARVYAIDVGRGQLAQKLRFNDKVKDMGGRDLLELQTGEFSPKADLAVVDVTFRSLADILPHVHHLLSGEQEIIALLKPLFEARLAGMGRVGEVQRRVMEYLLPRLGEAGLPVRDVIASEVAGSGGAVEFFLHIREPALPPAELQGRMQEALAAAKEILREGRRTRRGGRRRPH